MKYIMIVLFIGLLGVTAYQDRRNQKISNRWIVALSMVNLLSLFFDPEISLWNRLVGMGIVSIPLLIVSIAVPGAFGGGDIKLMAVAGFFLCMRRIAFSFVIGVVLAAVYSIILLIGGKADRHTKIAMGPFFTAGIIAALCLYPLN